MSHLTFHIPEAQFVRFGDGSRTGPTLTFRLAESAQLEPFRGEEGQRYALYIVKVLDTPQDETPAPVVTVGAPPPPEPERPALPRGGRLAKQAGIMCADRAFQRQVERDYPAAWREAVEKCDGDLAAAAASVVREVCLIDSRAELDHDAEAAERFQHCFWRPWRDAEAGITP
jgi:hypothetical protein